MKYIKLIIFILIFSACSNNKIEKGICFIESDFILPKKESKILLQSKIHKLYIKYFDIEWDKTKKQATFKNIVHFKDKPVRPFYIVPCIYIEKRMLNNSDIAFLEDLANKACIQILNLNEKYQLNENIIEIQIHYQWNNENLRNYLTFLKFINKNNLLEDKILTINIPLNQLQELQNIKNLPFEKGMLQCFNFQNSDNYNNQNSIFDLTEAEKYIDKINSCEFPLDFNLPSFSRCIVFNNEKYIYQTIKFDKNILSNYEIYENIQQNYYKALINNEINGMEIQKNYIIRFENVKEDDLLKFLEKIHIKSNNPSVSLSFYNLNSISEIKNKDKLFNALK